MIKNLKNSFFTGLILLLPIIITVALFTFLVKYVNDKLLAPIISLFGLDLYNANWWIYAVKFVAFIVTLLLIALIGAATRLLLLRNFFGFWETLLSKVPIVGKIYLAIKEISRAFLGQNRAVFEQVVLLEYPRKGIYSIAFLTQEACEEINKKTNTQGVYVFLPTTPNPTNGYFLIVPKKDIIPLKMSVADGLKLVISGGTFSPTIKSN